MSTYYEQRKIVIQFLREKKMTAWDLRRIAKDLCNCGKCRFFVEHYLKDGTQCDICHCIKNKIPKPCRISDCACGSWEDDEVQE